MVRFVGYDDVEVIRRELIQPFYKRLHGSEYDLLAVRRLLGFFYPARAVVVFYGLINEFFAVGYDEHSAPPFYMRKHDGLPKPRRHGNEIRTLWHPLYLIETLNLIIA